MTFLKVVKKIVYNDRIIAIKLQAGLISILMMQTYMPTSEHEDDEVEGLCDIIEEILERWKGLHKHHHNGGLE